MAFFLADDLDPATQYKLLMGLLVPRPIAWVTTFGPTGGINLAPFSAFTFVSALPLMLGISAGAKKDTAVNALASSEFVVNIADTSMLEPLHLSSIEHPPEVSEAAELGLELAASTVIRTPRLAVAPAAMECRLHSTTRYGTLETCFIVGEVVAFHIRDEIMRDGKVQASLLDPLARLGGPVYCGIGPEIRMETLHKLPPTTTPA